MKTSFNFEDKTRAEFDRKLKALCKKLGHKISKTVALQMMIEQFKV